MTYDGSFVGFLDLIFFFWVQGSIKPAHPEALERSRASLQSIKRIGRPSPYSTIIVINGSSAGVSFVTVKGRDAFDIKESFNTSITNTYWFWKEEIWTNCVYRGMKDTKGELQEKNEPESPISTFEMRSLKNC